MKYIKATILTLITIIIILLLYYINKIFPKLKIFDNIQVISTIVISIFTCVYAIIAIKQFGIMKSQLNEMKRSRELESQPLPYVKSIELTMEEPRLFYSPPQKEHSFQGRYRAKCNIKNVGNSPAICVDIFSKLVSKKLEIDDVCCRIGIIESHFENNDVRFLFNEPNNNIGDILDSLAEYKPREYPLLELKILYKNILGGCFKSICKYRIYPYNEDELTLKNTLISLKTFNIKYKDDIKSLIHYKQKVNEEEKWRISFDALKKKIHEDNNLVPLKFSVEPLTEIYHIEAITEEVYNSELHEVQYPFKIHASKKQEEQKENVLV